MGKPNYAVDTLANQHADISSIEFGKSATEIESTLHTLEMMCELTQEKELESICKKKIQQGRKILVQLGKANNGIL